MNTSEADKCNFTYGLKILGSYVGTEAFRIDRLRRYAEDLDDVKNKLMQYPDLQGRWLLFSKCFVYKPYHIFRTIPPELTLELALRFEQMKREVLASVMLINPEDVSEQLYSICNLSLANGGLGLHNVIEVRFAAFISSVVAFSQTRAGEALQVRGLILSAVDEHGNIIAASENLPPLWTSLFKSIINSRVFQNTTCVSCLKQ